MGGRHQEGGQQPDKQGRHVQANALPSGRHSHAWPYAARSLGSAAGGRAAAKAHRSMTGRQHSGKAHSNASDSHAAAMRAERWRQPKPCPDRKGQRAATGDPTHEAHHSITHRPSGLLAHCQSSISARPSGCPASPGC